MSLFCPKCQSLVFPKDGRLVCSNPNCGYEREIGKEDNEVITTKKKSKKETLIVEGYTDTLPTTRIECPKCGYNLATWVLRQMRAADEPETRIYRCKKCGHTWREF